MRPDSLVRQALYKSLTYLLTFQLHQVIGFRAQVKGLQLLLCRAKQFFGQYLLSLFTIQIYKTVSETEKEKKENLTKLN